MRYQILIKETLERVVPIEANNEREAIDQVLDRYHNGNIYLKAEDLTDTVVDNFDTMDKRRAEWLEELILDWIGKNYGTQEREDPCYGIKELAEHLVAQGF